MPVLDLLFGTTSAALALGALAMAATMPAWLVGRLVGLRRVEGRGSFLVETRRRRWSLWAIGSLTALIALAAIVNRGSGTAVSVVPLVVGALAAQYSAFYIGYARSVTRKARRGASEVLPPLAPIEVPAGPSGPTGLPPAVARPPASFGGQSIQDDLRAAQEEGYAPAQPIED